MLSINKTTGVIMSTSESIPDCPIAVNTHSQFSNTLVHAQNKNYSRYNSFNQKTRKESNTMLEYKKAANPGKDLTAPECNLRRRYTHIDKDNFNASCKKKRAWFNAVIYEFNLDSSKRDTLEAFIFLTDPVKGIGEPSLGHIREKRKSDASYKTVERHMSWFAEKGILQKSAGTRKNLPRTKTPPKTYVMTGFEYKLEDYSPKVSYSLNNNNYLDHTTITDHNDFRCLKPDLMESEQEYEQEIIRPTAPLNRPEPEKPDRAERSGKLLLSRADAEHVELGAEIENLIDSKLRDKHKQHEIKTTLKRLKCSVSDKRILAIRILEQVTKNCTRQTVRNVSAYIVQSFKNLLDERGDPENKLNKNLDLLSSCSEPAKQEIEIPSQVLDGSIEAVRRLSERYELTDNQLAMEIGNTTLGILLADESERCFTEKYKELVAEGYTLNDLVNLLDGGDYEGN